MCSNSVDFSLIHSSSQHMATLQGQCENTRGFWTIPALRDLRPFILVQKSSTKEKIKTKQQNSCLNLN